MNDWVNKHVEHEWLSWHFMRYSLCCNIELQDKYVCQHSQGEELHLWYSLIYLTRKSKVWLPSATPGSNNSRILSLGLSALFSASLLFCINCRQFCPYGDKSGQKRSRNLHLTSSAEYKKTDSPLIVPSKVLRLIFITHETYSGLG
jgi:hypothetical protein